MKEIKAFIHRSRIRQGDHGGGSGLTRCQPPGHCVT